MILFIPLDQMYWGKKEKHSDYVHSEQEYWIFFLIKSFVNDKCISTYKILSCETIIQIVVIYAYVTRRTGSKSFFL